MKRRSQAPIVLAASILISMGSGCATYTTISEARPGSAKVFSGTRLDVRAIAGETAKTKEFVVLPQKYPLLDLPFSFVLDAVLALMTTMAVV